jgi:hypothetical protein
MITQWHYYYDKHPYGFNYIIVGTFSKINGTWKIPVSEMRELMHNSTAYEIIRTIHYIWDTEGEDALREVVNGDIQLEKHMYYHECLHEVRGYLGFGKIKKHKGGVPWRLE